MRYYFLPQEHSIVLENIVFYSFVWWIMSFGMKQMDGNRVRYQIRNLQSDDIVSLVIENEVADFCP